MRTRPLGGQPVAAIGVGDVSLARAAARNVDPAVVSRCVHDALSAGLDIVDVAAEPDAERLVGEAVRALRVRDRVIVACNLPIDRLDVRQVQPRVEACLRATRLDALPLALLPVRGEWRTASAWPELSGTCARLVREGKVMRWGVAVALDDADAAGFSDEDWLVAIAVPYNLCARTAEPLLAGKLAVLARHPLAGGALAGGLGPGVKLAPDDDRRAVDLEAAAVAAAKLAAFAQQEPPSARSCDAARAQLAANRRPEQLECVTVAEVALRCLIDHGAIPLPRLHRPEHVATAVTAGSASGLSTSERIFSMFPAGEVPPHREPTEPVS